jgi:tetratricopeptide (TPR) repeat protein
MSGGWFWPTLAVTSTVVATWLWISGSGTGGAASWGTPVVSEDFADASWRKGWTETRHGAFTQENGHLTAQGERDSILVCNQRFTGSVALEFDGTMPTGVQPGDLSVVWTDGNAFDTMPPTVRGEHMRSVFLQTGAYDNDSADIVSQPGDHVQASNRFRLEPGRQYHVRAEIDGTHMALIVDGKVLCTYDDVFPFSSGYLGLYAYYPGKQFAHVRIYNKGVAETVPAVAIGDAFYQAGVFEQAAVEYQRVIASHKGSAMADQALFRQGMCRLVQGRWDEARVCWDQVRAPELKLKARIYTLDHLFDTGHLDELGAGFAALYKDNPDARAELRHHWTEWVSKLDHRDPALLLPVLAIENANFPDEYDSNGAAGAVLDRLGRWDEELKRFSDNTWIGWWALFRLGRYDEILQKFPDHHIARAATLLERAEYTKALPEAQRFAWGLQILALSTNDLDGFRRQFGADPRVLLMQGLSREAGDLAKPDDVWHCVALTQSGTRAEALANARDHAPQWGPDAAARLYVYLGRSAEARTLPLDLEQQHLVGAGEALEAAIAGDLPGAQRKAMATAALPWTGSWPHSWFERAVVLPFIARANGDANAVPAALTWARGQRWLLHQRPYLAAGVITGEVSASDFLAQPYRPAVNGDLALALAIRHDLANEAKAAADGYRAWLALPVVQRGIDGMEGLGDPLMERFATWRIGVLGAKDAAAATAPAPGIPAPAPIPATVDGVVPSAAEPPR